MNKLAAVWAAVMAMAFLLACGGGAAESAMTQDRLLGMESGPMGRAADFFDGPQQPQAAMAADQEVMMKEVAAGQIAPAQPAATAAPASNGAAPRLQAVERKVISTATLSLEVEDVQTAINETRAIAESVGGFVEHLTSSGGPARKRATVTVRVPQAEFSPALARIESLGSVQSATQGAEDVSERFIDLKARLDSALREEKSLLALLEKAGAVSEVLAIERELARVRSDIERFQGQLDFLERRVALATITVELSLPGERFPEPPSASLGVEVEDVGGSIEAARELVLSLNGHVDRVSITVNDGWETSHMTMRVFTADFPRMVEFLEGRGETRNKRVTQGGEAPPGAAVPPRPDAGIEVSFFEDPGGVNPALPAAGASLAVAALLSAVAYVFYRVGRRRRVARE